MLLASSVVALTFFFFWFFLFSGHQRHLGSYDTAEEAARCFDRATIRLRGPDEELNFPYDEYKDDSFLLTHAKVDRYRFLDLLRARFAIPSSAATIVTNKADRARHRTGAPSTPQQKIKKEDSDVFEMELSAGSNCLESCDGIQTQYDIGCELQNAARGGSQDRHRCFDSATAGLECDLYDSTAGLTTMERAVQFTRGSGNFPLESFICKAHSATLNGSGTMHGREETNCSLAASVGTRDAMRSMVSGHATDAPYQQQQQHRDHLQAVLGYLPTKVIHEESACYHGQQQHGQMRQSQGRSSYGGTIVSEVITAAKFETLYDQTDKSKIHHIRANAKDCEQSLVRASEERYISMNASDTGTSTVATGMASQREENVFLDLICPGLDEHSPNLIFTDILDDLKFSI